MAKQDYNKVFALYEYTLDLASVYAKQKNLFLLYIYILFVIPAMAILTGGAIIVTTIIGCLLAAIQIPYKILKGKND